MSEADADQGIRKSKKLTDQQFVTSRFRNLSVHGLVTKGQTNLIVLPTASFNLAGLNTTAGRRLPNHQLASSSAFEKARLKTWYGCSTQNTRATKFILMMSHWSANRGPSISDRLLKN
jgi:hypothetical protein